MKMKQLQKMMKQAQQMQERMEEEMRRMAVEGKSGGGMVTVTLDGKKNLTGISLEPEAVDPDDVEMLEDLVLTAVREAITKSQETATERLGGITGGLNIPGLT